MFPDSVDSQQFETSWLVQRCKSTSRPCSVQVRAYGGRMSRGDHRSEKKAGHLYKGVHSPVIYLVVLPILHHQGMCHVVRAPLHAVSQ